MSNQSTGGNVRIGDLELDVSPHDSSWFQSKLLNCITALHEADREEQLRIKGRVHALQDLFGVSDEELVGLAERYEASGKMREILADPSITDTDRSGGEDDGE
jgi:hypothetical protein